VCFLIADVDKRRLSGSNSAASYPDSQQVFVGNVPLSASEQDIKDIFSKYGTVVDLRLNCKAPAKGQPGKIFPKYGFVIFSDSAAVKYCLQSRVRNKFYG
jgi:Ras GTPase-activating protein-binding protein 1